jgi:hypothetical protein
VPIEICWKGGEAARLTQAEVMVQALQALICMAA